MKSPDTFPINNRLIVFSLFILIPGSLLLSGKDAWSQQPRQASLSLIARPAPDSVVLRWAPSTPGGWIVANQYGYLVERITIEDFNQISNDRFQLLTPEPLKPLGIEAWKQLAGPGNHFSAVAAQAVYGQVFVPDPVNQQGNGLLKNAADELSNRYSFSLFAADNDAITAQALGLRYVDHHVESGRRYGYRVRVAGPPANYTFDTVYVMVIAAELPLPPAPSGFVALEGDGSIGLRWEELPDYPYSGYYIERSDNEGKSFSALNLFPIAAVSGNDDENKARPFFNDTLTLNYHRYRYRLSGVTPFGERSQFAEITAMSKDLTPPPAPIILKPRQISSSEIEVSWKMKTRTPDLKGFLVAKSDQSDSEFRYITTTPLPPTATSYTDTHSGQSAVFYRVISVDTAGNVSASLPEMLSFVDPTPPSVPQNIHGRIDPNGKVVLSWSAGPESNLIGYRVLRANDPTHEFIQITNHIWPDTIFTDSVTVNTLSRQVLYKVAAINNRYQYSDLSEAIRLDRPDKSPPVEAVFSSVFVTDSSVVLKWFASSSPDLNYQLLYRKIAGAPDWTLLDTLGPNITDYADLKVQPKTTYFYTLVSIDQSGLSSCEAFPVSAKPYDSGKRNAVEALRAAYNRDTKLVRLTWSFKPAPNERTWYVLYKSVDGGDFKEYTSFDSSVFEYTDTNIQPGTLGYGIVVMTSGGGRSVMTKQSVVVQAE